LRRDSARWAGVSRGRRRLSSVLPQSPQTNIEARSERIAAGFVVVKRANLRSVPSLKATREQHEGQQGGGPLGGKRCRTLAGPAPGRQATQPTNSLLAAPRSGRCRARVWVVRPLPGRCGMRRARYVEFRGHDLPGCVRMSPHADWRMTCASGPAGERQRSRPSDPSEFPSLRPRGRRPENLLPAPEARRPRRLVPARNQTMGC
jgi:hypothetical protein